MIDATTGSPVRPAPLTWSRFPNILWKKLNSKYAPRLKAQFRESATRPKSALMGRTQKYDFLGIWTRAKFSLHDRQILRPLRYLPTQHRITLRSRFLAPCATGPRSRRVRKTILGFGHLRKLRRGTLHSNVDISKGNYRNRPCPRAM